MIPWLHVEAVQDVIQKFPKSVAFTSSGSHVALSQQSSAELSVWTYEISPWHVGRHRCYQSSWTDHDVGLSH